MDPGNFLSFLSSLVMSILLKRHILFSIFMWLLWEAFLSVSAESTTLSELEAPNIESFVL